TFGRVTLRDIQIASGQISLPEDEAAAYDSASISAAFRDTAQDTLDAVLAGARAALDNLQAIERIFSDRTPGHGPQLAEPVRLLQQIVQHLAVAAGVEGEMAEAAAEAPGAPDPATAGARSAPGSIASPADVR